MVKQMVFVLLPLAIEYARTSVTPEAACGFLGMCGGDAMTLPSVAAQVGARLVGGHACMPEVLLQADACMPFERCSEISPLLAPPGANAAMIASLF